MSDAVKKATAELARLVVMALVGWLLAVAAQWDSTLTVAIVVPVLRFVDKWLHENPNIDLPGLLPF